MRILLYGAGAMGTSFGALLQNKSGVAVDFVTRNVARVEYLKNHGATVSGVCDGERVNAMTPAEMGGQYDFIFLATKQQKSRETAEFLKSYLKADGALISLQNGLPELALAEVLDGDRLYGGALSWGAETEKDGAVKITSVAGYHIGLGAYGRGERLQEIANLLLPVFEVATGNLFEIRFAKLATNASFSTLSAISGLPFGAIAKRYKKYAVRLIREVFAVARAYGCERLPLNGHDLFKALTVLGGLLLPKAMKQYRNTRSGMLKDIAAGKRCDIDYVAGAVVRAGKEKGIDTPLLERAVALVHEIENGFAEIAPETIGLLDESV